MQVLGPEHPQTLDCAGGIAGSLSGQGKHAKAEQIHREELAIHKCVLGPEHPDTLISAANLAASLSFQGKNAEAEQIRREVLAVQKRVLGPEHSRTLTTASNLAVSLFDQCKYTEAQLLFEATLEERRRVLGPAHPDTLHTAGLLDKTWSHTRAVRLADFFARLCLSVYTQMFHDEAYVYVDDLLAGTEDGSDELEPLLTRMEPAHRQVLVTGLSEVRGGNAANSSDGGAAVPLESDVGSVSEFDVARRFNPLMLQPRRDARDREPQLNAPSTSTYPLSTADTTSATVRSRSASSGRGNRGSGGSNGAWRGRASGRGGRARGKGGRGRGRRGSGANSTNSNSDSPVEMRDAPLMSDDTFEVENATVSSEAVRLGCSRCRYSLGGCSQCRPAITGAEMTTDQAGMSGAAFDEESMESEDSVDRPSAVGAIANCSEPHEVHPLSLRIREAEETLPPNSPLTPLSYDESTNSGNAQYACVPTLSACFFYAHLYRATEKAWYR